MAFNPFHSFRKYSKVMFAILAIICMFTFVLSSGLGGGGDFFDQINRMVSSESPQNSVAEMFGEKVSQTKIFQVRQQRRIANQAMSGFVSRANLQLTRSIKAELPKLSNEIREMLTMPVTMKLQIAEPLETDNPLTIYQSMMRYRQALQFAPFQLRQRLQTITESENPADFLAIRRMLHVMDTDQLLMEATPLGMGGEAFYFVNAPMQTDRDILEFMLWSKKAEQMGIKLQSAEVKLEVTRETFSALRPTDAGLVIANLRQRFQELNVDDDTVLAALTAEFQVRIAQTALLGEAIGGRTRTVAPNYVTPREFFEYYKDMCSETRYFAFTLPVANYVPKITETPTEADLRTLWSAHRDQEPDPTRESPGFKAPRKISVEWVTGDPDTDYYTKLAPERLKHIQAATQIASGLNMPFGGGSIAAFDWITPLLFPDERLSVEYARYISRQLPWGNSFSKELRDSSVVRRQNIAAMVGQTLGAMVPGGTPFSAPLATEWMSIDTEVNTRVHVALPLVLSPLMGNPLVGVLQMAEKLPDPLPYAALAPAFRAELNGTMARTIFVNDMKTLSAEVAKLGKNPDVRAAKAAVSDYVAEFTKARGLKVGKSGPPQDKFALGKDPGLEPLKAVFNEGHAGMSDPNSPRFAESFYDQVIPGQQLIYAPKWYPNNQDPLVVPGGNPKIFLTWHTEDIAPDVRPFEDARKDVEIAWRLAKARELAKQTADDLSKAVAALQGNQKALTDYAEAKGLTWFPLGPAAKLLQEPGLQLGASTYRPYSIPKTNVANPSQSMVEDLLSIRNQPLGTARVLNDEPKDFYYVAVLVQREEKTEGSFVDVYARTSIPIDSGRDALFMRHMEPEKMLSGRKLVVDQLKAEAKYVEKEDQRERLGKMDIGS